MPGNTVLDLNPKLWIEFLAWPWICLITMMLPYDLDSWLDWP